MELDLNSFTLQTLVAIANAISEEIDSDDLPDEHQKMVFEAICENIESRGMVLSDNVVIPENL